MKNNLLLLALISIMLSCSSDESFDNNPFLPTPSFKYDINLDLPKYAAIQNPGSAIFVNEPYVGIAGVFVYNYGGGTFIAWEAACPNHLPNNDCRSMKLSTPLVQCECEDYQYDLLTGSINGQAKEGEKYYPLQAYHVNFRSGSGNRGVITISN